MIENSKFNVKPPMKVKNISDRDAAIRKIGNRIIWDHSMVQNLIIGKVEDLKIRAGVIAKLKQCPDGALEKFVENIDRKIEQVIREQNPTPQRSVSDMEKQESSGVSVQDLLNIRNSMSLDSVEDSPNECQDQA